MIRTKLMAAAVVAGLAISACTPTISLAPAGSFEAGRYTVQLKQNWNLVPAALTGVTTVDELTLDGLRLNRVMVVSGLEDGASLLREGEEAVPLFRSSMSELDLVEFFTDTVAGLGFQDVDTANVRPGEFAGSDGVYFDFSGAHPNGLRILGTAAASVSGEALDAMIFIAPEEYYYENSLEEVQELFASASPSS